MHKQITPISNPDFFADLDVFGDGDQLSRLRFKVLAALIRRTHYYRCSATPVDLADELGMCPTYVTSALMWLIERGAILHVPHEWRDDIETPPISTLEFELTGFVAFDDGALEWYLLMDDVDHDEMLLNVERFGDSRCKALIEKHGLSRFRVQRDRFDPPPF